MRAVVASKPNRYTALAQHTKDEMLAVLAWEMIFGSVDPEYGEHNIQLLLEAGANFVR